MPDDQNITKDTPIQNSSPTAPSDTPEMPSDAPEAPGDGFTPESPNNPLDIGNAGTVEPQNGPGNQDSPSGEAESEPVSESVQATEPRTAQISTNEPLTGSTPTEATPPVASSLNHMRELQAKEQLAIQNKKRKKLDLILTLFAKRKNITNDEVEKFLHVSDATATRYLSILEKEGKIKQNGKTGHMVSYSRI